MKNKFKKYSIIQSIFIMYLCNKYNYELSSEYENNLINFIQDYLQEKQDNFKLNYFTQKLLNKINNNILFCKEVQEYEVQKYEVK